ncbi:type I 3-dehydroquinate dehydratase [Phycisphaerales bacterium AB-hyl4]|uniref:Shikimate dehydrogenase (NADP(+)) n=1 Tax=Natronomicrosphaera hydrolytica TaxID=3242702 RepID=A0ABV4U1M9_9BACT
MTHLTVSIFVDQPDAALADAARAAEFGADLVEYRIDRLAAADEGEAAVLSLVERSALPCIITCRPTWEGGEYAGDEADRHRLLHRLATATHPPAYLDIELLAWQREPNLRDTLGPIVASANGPGLILSSHDFDQRPRNLLQTLEAMVREPACRVVKLAWQARSLRDNLEAFEVIAQQYKPTIALCMGEFGQASRILAKKFAGLLTFAALDEDSATAPGQPTLDQLKQLFRWDHLTPDTEVFGVIGWPVGHSKSPALHNAGFDATGYNGVYLPMPIPPEYEHFKATVSAWLDHKPLHFRGASVTIPHKENLLRFVRERDGEIEPLAEMIGAANTLTVRDDGSLYASNTDYAAALDAVCDGLNIQRDQLADRRVGLIGAGGAARAIAAGFAGHGASVVVYNRTLERAQAMADDLQGDITIEPIDHLPAGGCDVYINCTPIGMHPKVDASPLGDANAIADWGPTTVVFDTIYNPARTRLLAQAETLGCITVSGIEMFVRQGAAQFELWTGRPAPREIFLAVMQN